MIEVTYRVLCDVKECMNFTQDVHAITPSDEMPKPQRCPLDWNVISNRHFCDLHPVEIKNI